jgi:hypothetical protein
MAVAEKRLEHRRINDDVRSRDNDERITHFPQEKRAEREKEKYSYKEQQTKMTKRNTLLYSFERQ